MALSATKVDELTHTHDGGYILRPEMLDKNTKDIEHILTENADLGARLKRAKDGTILIPQPTEDPLDPLNWSWAKKHWILFIIIGATALGDYGVTGRIPTIIQQGAFWNKDPNDINANTNGICVLMVGISGLLSVPFAVRFGRAPVLFWFQLLTGVFYAVSAATTDYTTYQATSIISALFCAAGQAIGVSIIKDMFYFGEYTRKIGFWAVATILSPYAGPLIASFTVQTQNWQISLGITSVFYAVNILMLLFFMEETLYDRHNGDLHPQRESSLLFRLKTNIGIIGFREAKEMNRPSLWQAVLRIIKAWILPCQLLATIYYLPTFMWAVGINQSLVEFIAPPVEAGGYGFSPNEQAVMYFTPVVFGLIGEFWGHFFNDWLANRYIKQHHGLFEPEVRLWQNSIALVFLIAGLILLGFTFEDHLSVAGIIFGTGYSLM